MEIRDLISRRLDLIPKTRNEFVEFFKLGWPNHQNPEPWECTEITNDCGLYIYWKDKWTESIANEAIAAGQAIIDLYYDDGPTPSPVPAPTSNSCVDSPLRFKLTWNGKNIARNCIWVTNKLTSKRCAVEGVSAMCPKTCNTCDVCKDTSSRFKLVFNDKKITRSCEWVSNRFTEIRCTSDGVAESCRATCGVC